MTAEKNNFFKTWIGKYFGGYKNRNPFVNIILYAIELAALVAILPLLGGSIWSICLLDDPNWSFFSAYGKGFIPGLLLVVSILWGNSKILKWEKSGFYIMIIGFVLLFIPLIWNEFEEFLYFSSYSLIGILVYFAILKLPYRHNSVWNQCKIKSHVLKNLSISVLILWLGLVLCMPLFLGYITGFRNNIYQHGMDVVDARVNNDSWYSIKVYRDVLLSNDYSTTSTQGNNVIGHSDIDGGYSRELTARNWLQYAESKNLDEDNRYDIVIYNLIYAIKQGLLLNDDESAVLSLVIDNNIKSIDSLIDRIKNSYDAYYWSEYESSMILILEKFKNTSTDNELIKISNND